MSSAPPWTGEQVHASIDAYFQFWLGDIDDCQTKMDVYRMLHRRFPERSEKAFEFKFQNISGVIWVDGYEFMPGLKPRVNFQGLLRDEVRRYLVDHPDFVSAMALRA